VALSQALADWVRKVLASYTLLGKAPLHQIAGSWR